MLLVQALYQRNKGHGTPMSGEDRRSVFARHRIRRVVFESLCKKATVHVEQGCSDQRICRIRTS